MKWISVNDKLPDVEINGKKVLIYRIVNPSQSEIAMSIHETNMVRHCNKNETWWTELPEPPCTDKCPDCNSEMYFKDNLVICSSCCFSKCK